MERDYGKEIDSLKEQMESLQSMTAAQLDELRNLMLSLQPEKPSAETLKRVHVMLVTYLGVYNSGGRQSKRIVCCSRISL